MTRNHRQRASTTINAAVKSRLMQKVILQIGKWVDAHVRYKTPRLARSSLRKYRLRGQNRLIGGKGMLSLATGLFTLARD